MRNWSWLDATEEPDLEPKEEDNGSNETEDSNSKMDFVEKADSENETDGKIIDSEEVNVDSNNIFFNSSKLIKKI